MKKNIKKTALIALAGVMVIGGTAIGTASASATVSKITDENQSSDTKKSETSLLDSVISADTVDKEETVYVIAGADGSVEKVIVSELLKNPENADKLYDSSELTDIKNVKSDASYTLSDKSYIWDAAGEDIYYQGTTSKEVPVQFTISYKLDGKNVTTEELAGASGKLEMTFNYTNTQKETVEIDGVQEEIYVPFVMLSGMILDNNIFSNISVDNGKVISNGENSVVIGYAVPGLGDNLGIDESVMTIPSSVTITADVKEFELATTLTVATNSIFSGLNLDDVSTVDELKSSLSTLEESTAALVNGSSQLYEGTKQLVSGVAELSNGVTTLASGASQLKTGADSLYSGVTLVNEKLAQLNAGLTEISSNSATLNAGAKQVFDTLIATVQSQLDASGLSALGVTIPTLTVSNYQTELNTLIATLNAATASPVPQISTAAKAGAASVTAALQSLESYNTFYTGLCTYTAGVDTAAAGSTALYTAFADVVSGSKLIADNLQTLVDGIATLSTGVTTLSDGVTALDDGAKTLSEGMAQYSSEGINSLIEKVGDITPYFTRLKATVDVANNYQSFGGISDDMTGTVKFIYRTQEIK